MAVASLYFVRYTHGYLKSFPGNDNVKIFYKLPNALNRMIFYYTILFPPVSETISTFTMPVLDGHQNKSRYVQKLIVSYAYYDMRHRNYIY